MKKIMLDTNILRKLSQDIIYLTKFKRVQKESKIKPMITHIQEDEISRCPNEEQKQIVESINSEKIATNGFVLGLSRTDYARLGGGHSGLTGNKNMRKLKNWKDVLIGNTALNEANIFVTNDKDLRKRVKRINPKLRVIHYEEFKKFLDNL